MLHTSYGIYHLSRKAADRTPGSSASYMAFAAAADITFIPFYIFSAYMSGKQYQLFRNGATGSAADEEWTTLLPQGTTVMPTLTGAAFLATTITGGLLLISMGISIYLCLVFYKIMNLPPDMNPLEDNLTARPHKRNKSELSNMSVTTLAESEKRISMPLESRRYSGAPYEDLSRPPSIPFLHTRTGSTDSLNGRSSHGSKFDLPPRQYQALSPASSQSDLAMKRASYTPLSPTSSPLKQAYSTVSLKDSEAERPLSQHREAWFKADSSINADGPFPRIGTPKSRTPSPKKSNHNIGYAPLHQNSEAVDFASIATASEIHPLRSNPSSPTQPPHQSQGNSYDASTRAHDLPTKYVATHDYAALNSPELKFPNAFSEAIENKKQATKSPPATPTKSVPNPFTKSSRALVSLSQSTANVRQPSSTYSGDLADASVSDVSSVSSYNRSSEYGNSIKGGKRNLLASTNELSPVRELTSSSGLTQSFSFGSELSTIENENEQFSPAKITWTGNGVKAKAYGDLRPATPPVMLGLGGDIGTESTRQVSSGNDWFGRSRNVSGKVAEEGRAGATWGTRLRRISGIGDGTFSVKNA